MLRSLAGASLARAWSAASAARHSPAAAAPLSLPPRRARPLAAMASATSAPVSAAAGRASDVVIVHVTVPSREVGRAIAAALVGERLAACVNIIPGLESVYIWGGAVNADAEELLLIKSRAALVPALAARVDKLHPYGLAEVVAVPVTGGSDKYLSWVRDVTADASVTPADSAA
jgi:periplasmic divalent cation tolerance protein